MPLGGFESITFVCPIFVTGGTEAIHQANYAFNQYGVRSRIAYYGNGANHTRFGNNVVCSEPASNECLSVFANYAPKAESAFSLEDNRLIVVPEIFAANYKQFAPASTAIWWLSVDNVIKKHPELLDKHIKDGIFADDKLIHFFQSEYAHRFLVEMDAEKVYRLGDYVSEIYRFDGINPGKRGSGIIFNKQKGGALASRFFEGAKDIEHLALTGFSSESLVELYRNSSIYIDFGHFPGKDRMAREAAACGAIVFIHNDGAGKEFGDFPLSEFFRFSSADVESGDLARRVRVVMAAPATYWIKQAPFRRSVFCEKSYFYQDVMQLLGRQGPLIEGKQRPVTDLISFRGHEEYLMSVARFNGKLPM
ncbi:hypothetical protein [Beijerinckia sp. L45]|uniref:hypothetical protein n=1 Tax=Beijerinckia sp. L45 TaxID=1641855 RepID=UPI00131DA5A3|nr:hypothetical protein [Beijerinckia sp. L45]